MAPASSRHGVVLGGAAVGLVAVGLGYVLQQRRRRPGKDPRVLPEPRLPVHNVVEALRLRAMGPRQNEVALVPADGLEVTWAEYWEDVEAFGTALAVHDPEVEGGGGTAGVAIHAFNCPEWFYAALGAMTQGWTVSGIYNTNTYAQAAHILRTSDVRVLVLEDAELYEDTYAARVHLDFPSLRILVLADPDQRLGDANPLVLTYREFVVAGARATALGGAMPPARQLSASDVATLVYTSGTTGDPKAVAITHENLHTVVTMALDRVPLDDASHVISYLPLSHIAAQAIDLYQGLYSGCAVVFATKDALKGGLKQTLLDVRPTLFFGVPRVYEKIRAGMQKAAAVKYGKPGSGPVLKAIGDVAKWTATAWHSAGAADGPHFLVRVPLAPLYFLSKLLVYGPIKKALGLGRCRLLYTGAAPLRKDTQEYFRSLDMPLLEVYGMSESSGCIAVSSVADPPRPMGSCGRPLPGCEVVIAEDGEICCRGGNVMEGYRKNEAETMEMIGEDGLLHTGDLGRIDGDGFMYITGRKKELLITEGGENVAPVPIEDAVAKCCEEAGAAGAVGHIMVIGDQRKCLMCLVAVAEEAEPETRDDPAFSKSVARALATYNAELAKSRAQKVQNFAVVDAFTVESGDLTPTMKLKRSVIERKYIDTIDSLYDANPNPAA